MMKWFLPDFYSHVLVSRVQRSKLSITFYLNKTYFFLGLLYITPAHKQTAILTYFFMTCYGEIPVDNLYSWRVMSHVYGRLETNSSSSSHLSPDNIIQFFTFQKKEIFLSSIWFSESKIHFCHECSPWSVLIQAKKSSGMLTPGKKLSWFTPISAVFMTMLEVDSPYLLGTPAHHGGTTSQATFFGKNTFLWATNINLV